MIAAELEGPPTAEEMQDVARRLMISGEFLRVKQLAEVMVSHWTTRHDTTGTISFGWWLGIAAAASLLKHAEDRRALQQIRSRTRRSA